jgi:hypothetical protein
MENRGRRIVEMLLEYGRMEEEYRMRRDLREKAAI